MQQLHIDAYILGEGVEGDHVKVFSFFLILIL